MSRLQKPSILTVGVPDVLTFTIYDDVAKAVEDLTGYTGNCVIANTINPTTSVLSVAIAIVSASAGTLSVTLSAANLTTLGVGRFTCQLQLSVGGLGNTVVDQHELIVRGVIA